MQNSHCFQSESVYGFFLIKCFIYTYIYTNLHYATRLNIEMFKVSNTTTLMSVYISWIT